MGAPKGNKYSVKPPELKAKPCTFKLKPETIAIIARYAKDNDISQAKVIALAVSRL